MGKRGGGKGRRQLSSGIIFLRSAVRLCEEKKRGRTVDGPYGNVA